MNLTLMLLMTLIPQTSNVHQCLSYEPTVVTLSGRLSRQTFPGPPNYQNVRKGDAREVVWLLNLSSPICVLGNGEAEEEKNVSELQLAFTAPEEQYRQYRPLLGRKVSVYGTLFHSHTGHHRTRVLVSVNSVRSLRLVTKKGHAPAMNAAGIRYRSR